MNNLEFDYNTYDEAVETSVKLALEKNLNINHIDFDVDNNKVIIKSSEDIELFNQRVAWVAQALQALLKYGPIVIEIIQAVKGMMTESKSEESKSEVIAIDDSIYKEAGFVDNVIDALKGLSSNLPQILRNKSTQEMLAKKFNMDETTVKFITDSLATIVESMTSNPEEVEKEKSKVNEQQPEMQQTQESKITPASKYTQVSTATQINSNSFLVKEGSDDFNKLEDQIIALAKEYGVRDVQDIEIELSKEGNIISIRKKSAELGLRNKDFGMTSGMTGLVSVVTGMVTNPTGSWVDRIKEFGAGYLGGPLGSAGYHIGKKFGHEYIGFFAGYVLQGILNQTLTSNDPNATEEDKQKANQNAQNIKADSYTNFLKLKQMNPTNKSIALVQDRMKKDSVDEETAFWRCLNDNAQQIIKSSQEAA